MSEKRENWSSRATFILAAIGSAVGLGNAWRFPGLAAKYGGGAFLLVYVLAMLIIGVPLLTMEIAIGRKTKQGAPGAMRAINKKTEWIGWTATSNAFAISTYYSVVFAWVIIMVVSSVKFASMTGNGEEASNLFANVTRTTWGIEGAAITPVVFGALLVAWVLIYMCIRRGTVSAGKVVKYTGITLPLLFLAIMAIKGLTMPGSMEGVAKLFIPDFKSVMEEKLLSSLIIDAIGQVFYSLSIMMAIMFAYGSYLSDSANIAVDALIIAFSDLAVSVLSGLVMFTTMYGVGMTTADMSSSGIATAFIIYPQAIVSLTGNGWVNAIFGMVFYMCLASLAIDSAFSIIEGVSTAVADKFKLNHRKATLGTCIVAAIISVIYTTGAGLAWLDIVDNWTNQYAMIIVGVLECIAVAWCFKPHKVLDEVNRNTVNYKMPAWWFITSIKFVAPLALVIFCGWNITSLFKNQGGIYGGYPLWSNIAGGWAVLALSLLSGFIIKFIISVKKLDVEEKSWDEIE